MKAWILTVSDRAAAGQRVDRGGPLLETALRKVGITDIHRALVPDEQAQIEEQLREAIDVEEASLVLTTGGTGFSLRDVTPEATRAVADREVPGIAEWMRILGLEHTPRSMLSRGCCALRGRCVIVNFPGSPRAISETVDQVLPVLLHGLQTLNQPGQDCARTE